MRRRSALPRRSCADLGMVEGARVHKSRRKPRKKTKEVGVTASESPSQAEEEDDEGWCWSRIDLGGWRRDDGRWKRGRLREVSGDFSKKYGNLEFGDYSNYTKDSESTTNLLNKNCKKAQGVNTTCLPRKPIVTRVEKGVTANVFVDNKAYREFLHFKFDATPIEMETAAVALVCFQQNTPFIAIRSLSDLAGGGTALSDEADVFGLLASQNAFEAVAKFISMINLISFLK
ncbi:hypothetical protein Fmac_030265 [Flemingia macrophylla]|uniref:Nucleoside phosphorylase domain-containing protein n=1 Tax=Flemingia macrophylla TaxID=520843 RepID=A0ABD1LCP3_9FABA